MGMMFSTPTMLCITFAGLHYISLPIACVAIFATIFIYLILLKVFKAMGKTSRESTLMSFSSVTKEKVGMPNFHVWLRPVAKKRSRLLLLV